MKVEILDDDLKTLYETGKGKGRYKKLDRDKKFVSSRNVARLDASHRKAIPFAFTIPLRATVS